MRYCFKCNAPLSGEDPFCSNCGANNTAMPSATGKDNVQPVAPTGYNYRNTPAGAQFFEPPKPASSKSGRGLIITIIVLATILLVGGSIGAFVLFGSSSTPNRASTEATNGEDTLSAPVIEVKSKEIPEVTYSYLDYKPEVKVSYTYEKSIYPRQYNRLDSIAVVTLYGVHGESTVRISAEIPGFTQSFSKTLTVGREHSEIFIKPSLVSGDLGLKSAKNGQLNLKVENTGTGEVLLEETLSVKLYSENDINNYDPQWGNSSCDAYLAFLTPEDNAMDAVSREAIPIMNELSKGQINAYAGYQYNSPEATYYQVLATQMAISQMGVRYDAGAYSNSDAYLALQSVKLPREVIEKKSGLCVETSLLLSSVLMNEGMHCFLLFPPGHCQVAVETNTNSGEYFLVETTILPVTKSNMDNVVTYLTAEEMDEYIAYAYRSEVYVVDCGLVDDLDFQYVNN